MLTRVAAALVTLTCTPVSLVLGLAAYVQIRRTGRRGLPLAVYGIVAGVVLLVVYALMLLSSLGSIGGPAI